MHTQQRLTCEVISRPRAQFTGSAGVLVGNKLIFFTGSARPAAAHLTFTDHLERKRCTVSVSTFDFSCAPGAVLCGAFYSSDQNENAS